MELDKIDKAILNILQENAKITNAALAQKINLSPAATLERVKKLEQHTVITHYCTQLDYAKVGLGTTLIVGVRLQKMTIASVKLFKASIDKIAFITNCYQVIGDFDFILKIATHDMISYQSMILEKLYTLDIIESIKTLPITQIVKDKPVII